MKAVVVHFDPRARELCIATAADLELPQNALEVVRIGQEDLSKLETSEINRRLAETIIELLEVFHQGKIRKGVP